MKETIYTIPVSEAYDTDSECPLCELHKKLEAESVAYALGGAMMEPDFRILSNEKGYCPAHYEKMFRAPNKLPLALVLDTHLKSVREKLSLLAKASSVTEKKGLFKKESKSDASQALAKALGEISGSCLVCERINSTMERYIDVLLYMWATDEDFREKFDRSKGVCLKHMHMLCEALSKSLRGDDAKRFLDALIEKELTELERVQNDIHNFTLKFDYRNHDMPWGTAKDAPERTIEKLAGACIEE